MIKLIFTLVVICCFGFTLANQLREFTSGAKWENFVLEELPKFGKAGGEEEEQRCLEHLAKKGTSGTILANRIISYSELNEGVRASQGRGLAPLLMYYRDRLSLAAHKEKNSITFFFNVLIRNGNQLWCFARKDLP